MIKHKLISSFSFTLLSSGLFFIFNFSIAKILGADIYGEIVYYLSFIQILALLIGMNYTSLYMGSRITNGDKDTFSLFFSLHSLLFILISIPAFFLLDYFFQTIEEKFLILSIAYLIVFITMVGLEYNAQKNISSSILVSMLIPRVLLMFFFSVLIFLNQATPSRYLYVYLYTHLILFIYFMYIFKPYWYIKKEIFSRAWKFYLLGIVGTSFGYIAQILQKKYTGYEELATLAIVLLIFSGLNLIGAVLVKFILPKIHEYYSYKMFDKIGEIYAQNTFLVLIFISPILLVLIFNIEKISYILGDGYKLLPNYFYILLIGYLIDLFTGITGHILRSTENEKYELFNETTRMFFGLLLIYLLKDNTTFGVVIAISTSMAIYNLLKYIEVFYLFSFIPIKKDDLRDILIFIVPLSIILFIISYINVLSLYIFSNTIVLLLCYLIIFKYLKTKQTLLKGYE